MSAEKRLPRVHDGSCTACLQRVPGLHSKTRRTLSFIFYVCPDMR